MRWTNEQFEEYKNKHPEVKSKSTYNSITVQKESKKSKYNNKKTRIDGHTFDSKKEAEYYKDLRLRLNANDILGFCIQPKFILSDEISYKADFIIFEYDKTRVIDIKGFETDVFRLKRKLFESKYPKLELEVIK